MFRSLFFLTGDRVFAAAVIGVLALSITSPVRSAGLPATAANKGSAASAVSANRATASSGKWFFLYMERGQTPITVGPFATVHQCNEIRQRAIVQGSKSFTDAAEHYVPRYIACWQS